MSVGKWYVCTIECHVGVKERGSSFIIWYTKISSILLNEEEQYSAQMVGCYHLSKNYKSKYFWKDIKETAYIVCLQGKGVSSKIRKWKDTF